ncbi:MAG: hypothetical protein B7Z06_05550 [Flavobacteriales bacterium 32-35-8]|nr:MAG: hypothetical protein B7Z06_05550 [Flavobacteriales bacterium 32-35-8]
MPHLIALVSDSTKIKLITSKSTLGGATLSNHWHGERGLKTKELIKSGGFDIVVLQEFSMGTIDNPEIFLEYAKKFCDYIKENGSKPYFYETWTRERIPQFQKTITEMYYKAAKENDAGLVKVGEARELALKLRPELELYQADGSHPSNLGALLAACLFVKEFTNEIPNKLPSRFTIMDGEGESLDLLDFINQLDISFFLEIVKEISTNKMAIKYDDEENRNK